MVTNRRQHLFAAAVKSLVLLARDPRGMATSAEVADAIGRHPVVVRRLLGILRSSGIVESRSGPGGGWAIARDPARVRLSDVYGALAAGTDDDESAPAEPQSVIDRALASADAAYFARLAEFSLDDVRRPSPTRNLEHGGAP